MQFKNAIKRWSYNHFIAPLNEVKILESKSLAINIRGLGKLKNLQDAEFKVFSQFGDDGIIQYILDKLNIKSPNDKFIEFGVGDYTESNTRYVLVNNNWKGLVIDSSKENIDFIKTDEIYWKHDLTALCKFIEPKNINKILLDSNFTENIGILHIDLDGNDYWVWKSLSVCRPIVVIIEYNSVFGYSNAITIPYKANFVRNKAHYSNLYWGTSLKALLMLAKEKGYEFIGSNSAGNNAYFIRKDYSKAFTVLSLKKGYVSSKYRESRNKGGQLDYVSGTGRLKLIENMPVFDLKKNKILAIKNLIFNER